MASDNKRSINTKHCCHFIYIEKSYSRILEKFCRFFFAAAAACLVVDHILGSGAEPRVTLDDFRDSVEEVFLTDTLAS